MFSVEYPNERIRGEPIFGASQEELRDVAEDVFGAVWRENGKDERRTAASAGADLEHAELATLGKPAGERLHGVRQKRVEGKSERRIPVDVLGLFRRPVRKEQLQRISRSGQNLREPVAAADDERELLGEIRERGAHVCADDSRVSGFERAHHRPRCAAFCEHPFVGKHHQESRKQTPGTVRRSRADLRARLRRTTDPAGAATRA